MKRLALALFLVVSGCNESVSNELTGQVKKVLHNTPILCPRYDVADVSLGVMRNGVGSMSTQDVWLTVTDKGDLVKLNEAVGLGALVKITYDVLRFPICVEGHILTSVEVLK